MCVVPTNTLIMDAYTQQWGWTDSTYGSRKDGGEKKKNTSSHLMIDFTHHMTDTGNQTCVCAMCYTVCLRWLQLESIFPQDDTSHPSPALPASPCLIIYFAYVLPALLQLILLSWWTTPWLKVTFFTYPIVYRTVLRQSSKLHKMCVRTQ